jgi:hypothetical protein
MSSNALDQPVFGVLLAVAFYSFGDDVVAFLSQLTYPSSQPKATPSLKCVNGCYAFSSLKRVDYFFCLCKFSSSHFFSFGLWPA